MTPKVPSRGRILLVDDEPNARSALRELLAEEGYAVEVAADGYEALGKLAGFGPDLVLTDLKMPGMDGLELLRLIRQRESELPVVVMSAFGELETAIEIMRAGARNYLRKPVKFGELTALLVEEIGPASKRGATGSGRGDER